MAARKDRWKYVHKNLTSNQLEALLYTLPAPLGAGLTPDQYALIKKRNTSVRREQLRKVKRNFPEAWEHIEAIRNSTTRQERNLRRPLSLQAPGPFKILRKF